jgi:hypothetical protein
MWAQLRVGSAADLSPEGWSAWGGMPWGTPAGGTLRSHAGAATSALTWRAPVSARAAAGCATAPR